MRVLINYLIKRIFSHIIYYQPTAHNQPAMPTATNFAQCKIVTISSKLINKSYTCYTTSQPQSKLATLRANRNNFNSGKTKLEQPYFNIINSSDCKIENVYDFPCDSLEAANAEVIRYASEIPNSVNDLRTVHERKLQHYKNYYISEKDKVLERHKLMYYANKSELVDCVCGGSYRIRTRKEHLKTQIHNNYIERVGESNVYSSDSE